MSEPTDTASALPLAAGYSAAHMRMTPAKLRAQRANARPSTGPRTEAGRRRAAQNRRKLRLSRFLLETLEWHGADLAEVRRLWRDVMAVFWFIDFGCSFYLQMAAYNWWLKLDALCKGSGKEEYRKRVEGDTEKYPRFAADRFAKGRHRWDRWLWKELGADGRDSMWSVRLAVKKRLRTFQRATGAAIRGGPPYSRFWLRTQSSI